MNAAQAENPKPKTQNSAPQVAGCLPDGYGLDSLLTPEQFAVWTQQGDGLVRRRLPGMRGARQESRNCWRIHPRTYLGVGG